MQISKICMFKLLMLAAGLFHFSSARRSCTPVQCRFALNASVCALARTQPAHWLPCEAVHPASDLSRRSHRLLLKTRRSPWCRLRLPLARLWVPIPMTASHAQRMIA